MEPWLIALLLLPLWQLFIRGFIALPISWLIRKLMPEGRVKRFLLRDFGKPKSGLNPTGEHHQADKFVR